jgi:protein TonB
MFQSVIDQQGWNARRLGAGAGVSVLVHAGIVGAVLVLTAGVAEQVEKEPPVVVFKRPPPRGTPIPKQQAAAPQPPKPKPPKPKPFEIKAPSTVPITKPAEATPTPDPQPEPDDDLPYDPNGRPDGLAGIAPCMTCAIDPNATATNEVEPTGEEVLPYASGNMTPPQLLTGASLQYTREALEARVEGLLIARCVITREGVVEGCKVIKGLPHMSDAVVSALETRRYSPVTYQGRPISVTYNFHVKLDLPR